MKYFLIFLLMILSGCMEDGHLSTHAYGDCVIEELRVSSDRVYIAHCPERTETTTFKPAKSPARVVINRIPDNSIRIVKE